MQESRDIPANDAVRGEWLRRIEAEYRSAAYTQHLTLWMMQLGAPPDLLALGLRIAGDELAHAELSAAVYREAGGAGGPQLARDTLALPRRAGVALEHEVLRAAVEHFCLGETVAVRLFARMRKQVRVPIVEKALRRIVRDETVHRDFGWALLTWLLSTPLAQNFRKQLGAELPALIEGVRNNYGAAIAKQLDEQQRSTLAREYDAANRAWGLMPLAEYVAAVEETIERDYRPRFRELGVEFTRL